MRWAAALLLLAWTLYAEGRWRMQYFHDEDDASLSISDLAFPTARHGVVTGALVSKSGDKPFCAFTRDGGATWTRVATREPGLSLFFLDESLGWMVTPKGLWRTDEGGRGWVKIKAPNDILKVWFLDPKHGFAVGLYKGFWETHDGGASWQPVAVAKALKANPAYTSFNTIEFLPGGIGMVSGMSRPPRKRGPEHPAWLDPKSSEDFAEWPALTFLFETKDGGKSWTEQTTSVFGQVSRIHLTPEGGGLALLEFFNAFQWPSEVYRLAWRTGKMERVFREKETSITDVAMSAGAAWLAGREAPGKLRATPVPQKVRVLRTADWVKWEVMPVDYRAVARRVILRRVDDENLWLATDTGMILRWAP